MDNIRRGVKMRSGRIKSFRKTINFHPSRNNSEKNSGSRKKILSTQESFLQNWNKILLLNCMIALALDPFFFYIPVVVYSEAQKCLKLDENLGIFLCVFRTVMDAFYVIHMIFQFRTGFIAASSRVFGRGESIDDPGTIAKRYSFTDFIIDFLAILPLPQLVIWNVNTLLEGPVALAKMKWLKYIIFCQYVPRIVRIFPLYREVEGISGIRPTAWAGAASNLIPYILASHVLGAIWYLSSVERQDQCRSLVARENGFHNALLYCDDDKGRTVTNNSAEFALLTLLDTSCSSNNSDEVTDSTVFNFGIFIDAIQSGIVENEFFLKRFFYCFLWGLHTLSSLGQNLSSTSATVEIFFAAVISIVGLVLFALLIGNMQKYLQSITAVKVEEMRVKKKDVEQWMKHRMLPADVRERIRRHEQYKWQETRGFEEESLIRCLPRDLRRDIRRHLCVDLLMRVPMFEKMDGQFLDALCDRLKPELYTEDGYIVREGGLVEEMLFIIRGNLVSTTTNGGITGFFNAVYLKAGDFCGEALIIWALDPQSSNLPISTRTVQALSEVEAFVLLADDLKFVVSQFWRHHGNQLQHTFRFYSLQWRTWAACFIQAAWRQYCKRKLLKLLREEES